MLVYCDVRHQEIDKLPLHIELVEYNRLFSRSKRRYMLCDKNALINVLYWLL